MARKYCICPYCNEKFALSGIRFHVKSKHPEKVADFEKIYQDIKEAAFIPDGNEAVPEAHKEAPEKKDPPKVPKTQRPPKIPPPAPVEAPEDKAGDNPQKGGSFLDEIREWFKEKFSPIE